MFTSMCLIRSFAAQELILQSHKTLQKALIVLDAGRTSGLKSEGEDTLSRAIDLARRMVEPLPCETHRRQDVQEVNESRKERRQGHSPRTGPRIAGNGRPSRRLGLW